MPLQVQVKEAQDRLAREKATRMVEAEEKLDQAAPSGELLVQVSFARRAPPQAIAERLKEAEEKLRQEVPECCPTRNAWRHGAAWRIRPKAE